MPYTSSSTAPHRAAQQECGAPQRVPYQQRTTQRDNPTQQLIKQAVDFLIQQLEAGKSETLTAYLRRNGPVSCVFLREYFANRQTESSDILYTSLESINMRVCASLDTHDGARRPV